MNITNVTYSSEWCAGCRFAQRPAQTHCAEDDQQGASRGRSDGSQTWRLPHKDRRTSRPRRQRSDLDDRLWVCRNDQEVLEGQKTHLKERCATWIYEAALLWRISRANTHFEALQSSNSSDDSWQLRTVTYQTAFRVYFEFSEYVLLGAFT